MTPAPVLRLVTATETRESEQLLLRPFFAVAEAATEPPAVVRYGCRRKPGVKRAKRVVIAAPPELAVQYGPYRPRVEVIVLPPAPAQVFRLVPTSRLRHPRSARRKELAIGGKRSMGTGAMTEAEYLELNDLEGNLAADGMLPWRDESCAEILAGDHPCYKASCKHNTRIEIRRTNGVESVCFNHPGKDVDEVPETCSIRFARNNPDGATQEEVAVVMGYAGQRVQQIENEALAKLRDAGVGREWLAAMFAAGFGEDE